MRLIGHSLADRVGEFAGPGVFDVQRDGVGQQRLEALRGQGGLVFRPLPEPGQVLLFRHREIFFQSLDVVKQAPTLLGWRWHQPGENDVDDCQQDQSDDEGQADVGGNQ